MPAFGDFHESGAGDSVREFAREWCRRRAVERADHHERRIADAGEQRREIDLRKRQARAAEAGGVGLGERRFALGDQIGGLAATKPAGTCG